MHNDITFGVVIGIGYWRPQYCYSSTVPKHSVTFGAGPSNSTTFGAGLNNSTTNGNQPSITFGPSDSVIIGVGPKQWYYIW